MVGRGGKVAGGILFALGAVVVIAGAAAVVFAVQDQADNEQAGPLGLGEDQEQSEQNLGRATAGTAAMAIGSLLVVAGSVAALVGIAQRSAEVRQAWRLHRDELAAEAPVVEAPAQRRLVFAAVAVAALLLVAVVAVGASYKAGALGPKEDLQDTAAAHLGNETFRRSVPPSFSLQGNANSIESTSHGFRAKEGARSLVAAIDWTPATGGLQEIQFSVEMQDGTAWRELARVVGGPGSSLAVLASDLPADHRLDQLPLRFRAFPADTDATAGQDYVVVVASYSSLVPE